MAKAKKDKRAEYSQPEQTADVLERGMHDLMVAYNRKFNKENPLCAARASDLAEMEMVQPVPTGHISFDLMTGIGGLPRGKIIEFTGEEGTHKSNMAWECVGNVHAEKPHAFCVWLDAEKALDVRVPKQRRHILNMGVDLERLIICVPDTAEQCWQMIDMACDKGAELIVLDSISALIPKKEFDVDYDAPGYPALPAAINKGFRKLTTKLFRTGSTLIEINQVRENLETAGQRYVKFEDRWKTTGGKGLKHWLTLRLFFSKSKITVEGRDGQKQHVGDKVTVKVMKTRLAPVVSKAEMFMYHASGFDTIEETLLMAENYGVLYKEKQTSRNLKWRGYEEDIDAMPWSDWYDYLLDSDDAFDMMNESVVDAYHEQHNDADEIDSELAEQEGEADEEEE